MDDFYKTSKPRKKSGQKPLPVYQFDIEGKLIFMHASLEIASENLLISKHVIKSAMRRKSLYDRQWYFSRKKDFVIPQKKRGHNPLLTQLKTTELFSFDDED
jgi:hypothetical protein